MEEAPSRDDAPNTSRDVSGVLNASSYSLRDISDSESFAKADDAELLDESVLALLDKPYSQLQDRMHLRRQDQYDGFDNSTGSSWIYPTNYPVRQYQFTITKAALFKNTLVVLPTGLGKTFIAAVVMYNIYRWYPTGKVIFMAPTRPLVAQQIDACYRIMGIPRKDTAEITGKQQRKSRAELWQTKRVFYVTPQVVQADLCAPAQAFPVEQVRLVVIDEAHKAKGRYAYTEVIRMIAARNKHFRVLALSATPGRTLQDVAEVIQNLLISHIEVRWENSIDVSPYTFRRKLRTIVIPLGETIRTIRTELQQLVNPYMQRLCDANVLYCGNPALMTRGMLIMEQKRFRENSLLCRHPQHSTVNADFGVCVSMFHAIDLLVRHGIRALLNFFADGGEGASEKYFVAKDPLIKQFLERLRERYGGRDDGLDVPNGAAALPTTGDDDVEFGHPKFRILEEQLSTHFADHPDSKAIVFCEFRDSVAMIHRLLSQRAPLIRPKCIVGQGGTSGIRAVTQKEQIAAMKQFRDGVCNTLIATCVAEEGIDVGEVDLIVCFDITKNPTRFVQRIGRTGRQRVGRVLMLVTGGEEHDTLKRVLASKDRTNQQLARSKDIMRSLYRHSPRLVPAEFEPQCVEMFITIEQEDGAQGNAASGAGKRTSTKREHDIEEASKRRKVAGASTTTTSPKGTQDLRRFFQRPRARFPADGELDASERDVFSFVDQQPAERRPKQPDHTVSRPHTTPVDRCIRPGRSDQELAIERRVRPLVCHYELLKKQNFIHRQQLLDVPTVEQIRQRRKLAIIRSEVARQLLGPPRNAPCDTDQVVKIDDPFDLPSLRALPESYRFHCRASDDSPRFRTCASPPDVPPPVPPSPVIEAFTSNMFDSTLNLSDLEHTGNLGANRVTTGWESTTTVPSSANRKRTAPVDSPLMRAFDRSMRKRRLDDGRSAPVGTSHAKSHTSTASSVPAPETPPLTAQVASRRKLAEGAVPGRTPTVDSPLMRAFHRSVQKRSNSNGGQQGGADSILQRQMVLEFFKLDSLEQIFDDDSEEEPLRKDNTVTLVEARNDTNAGSSIQSTSVIDVSPEKQSEQEKESAPSGEAAEPTDRGESSRCISRKTSRFPALPDPDQENRSSSKNFNLGSPVLVLDESDDDLFGSLDSKKNEPTVVVPLERKEEELKNQRKQRTPTAKPILVERQQQEQPVGHGSHFEMIQKSPSVFAKRPRVASKSRLAPTKLNFSRLCPDQNRQLPSAPENNDVLPRPSPPVERTSSAFFNTCDSQMMSSPTSSAHRSSSKNLSRGAPVLVLDESDDDLFVSLDSKKNEPTVVVPLERKEEELKNQRKQRTPTAKSILVEAQQQEHPVGHGSHFEMIKKSTSVFAKRPRVASKSRLAPTKLNFSHQCPDQNRQLPSAPENNDVLPRPCPPVERTSSAFFNTCDSQMMSSPTASPLQPEADRAMDLNESTVIGHRLMRGRPMHHPITSNLESEDEAENVGSLTAGRLLTATMKEKLNDDDSDDIFEKGKSRSSCIRPNRKSTELPQTRPMMPSTSLATATRQNKRKKARATARCFFDSQAAVSGSEEEDEDEPNEWMGMDSFIDPGGSQSSQADATCVDMRAVYLQSVRSPMVARGGFKIPASRLFTEHDHSSPHPSMDLVDNDDEDDDGEHFENTSGKPDDVREEQEAMESSFINDEVVVEIDSELSELEQAELVLRERRRAAKRKRQQRTESERTNTKRRRRIIILSDSE
uniref:Uncharacterized protein n=1 Tax=Anopheles atroparvus TaxID=41427 RepID=A0A182JM35_ANOAO